MTLPQKDIDYTHMSLEQQEQSDKEILTIEKVLGPNSNYDQIVIDLKSLLEKHEGIVVSDYKEDGIYATNAYFTKEKNRPVDPEEYDDAYQEWLAFKKKKNIQVPTEVLGRFLYCKGEKELARQIDMGHGPAGQEHPEEYLHNTVCLN